MKLMIVLLSLFVSLINGQLRCFRCENEPTLEACLFNGIIDMCPSYAQACATEVRRRGDELSYSKTCKSRFACNNKIQQACATEVRRRGDELSYFKTCKKILVCHNNKIQNPRAVPTPTQCNYFGEVSVCRCCCFSDECGKKENCTDIDVTLFSTLKNPTITPELCPPPEEWNGGEIECPEPEKQPYPIGTVCNYNCPSNHVLVGSPNTTCETRFNQTSGMSETRFHPGHPCCETPCHKAADVVFVLDSSTSIGAVRWIKIIEFIQTVAEQVPVSVEGVHFGIITYGRIVYEQDIIKLDDATTAIGFVEMLGELDYRRGRGGTYTPTALNYTAENAFTSAFGSRSKVDKIVIFVTNGRTTRSRLKFLPGALKKLREVVAKVYAVGINTFRKETSLEELRQIASSPSDVSQIGFDELTGSQLLRSVTSFICDDNRCPR